jgi:hypothetical protein
MQNLLITILFFCFIQSSVLDARAAKNIDVVYTWVDNQDPIWQEAYNKTKVAYGLVATPDAKVKSRFRNRDELKFSLRSIHAFAPFVHHIYIVTFGHSPSWLKSHKKVTVISHKDIFPRTQDLPTFNSQAIEANLHRIPNLKEHFIYFNDDVFLGRKVKRSDFFSKRDKIKVLNEDDISQKGHVLPTDIAFVASWKNANNLLDTYFGVRNRPYLKHAPFALRKSIIRKLEKRFPTVFTTVSSHRFRSPEDYVLTCGLIQNYALHLGLSRKGTLTNHTIAFIDDMEENRKKLKRLYDEQPDTFCIEDIANTDNPAADLQLSRFLYAYFPQKAPWEK